MMLTNLKVEMFHLELVAILVMHKPMLLESLGLDGEHVTWAWWD